MVDHFLSEHTSLDISSEHCMEALKTCSEDLYNYGKLLNQIFRDIWNNNKILILYEFIPVFVFCVLYAILHKGHEMSINLHSRVSNVFIACKYIVKGDYGFA